MIVNLTVLRWIGVYQEMMPEAQSVEAFLAWWDVLNVTCSEGTVEFAS